MNDKNQVLCHHFSGVRGSLDIYSLMRQTVEPDKSLEEMVTIGLAEEFGVKVKIESYLGSIVSNFTNWEKADIEKTTVYFLCKYEGNIENPQIKDEKLQWENAKSTVEWVALDELITKIKAQAVVFERTDYNESSILQKVKLGI